MSTLTTLTQPTQRLAGVGYEIVHTLTEEPWGTRRFFVRDPDGVVVNVVGHPD